MNIKNIKRYLKLNNLINNLFYKKMANVDIDFSYLNNAIREDEIKRSKGKMKIDIEMEKN